MLTADEFDRVRRAARRFPDLESWKFVEPDTYFLAEMGRHLEDPNVTAHMMSRKRISEGNVRSVAQYYRDVSTWRDKDPATYWRASDLGLLEDETVVGHMKTSPIKLTAQEIRNRALRYSSVKEWEEKDPRSHKSAARMRLLGNPVITGHMEGHSRLISSLDIMRSMIRYPDMKSWSMAEPDMFKAAGDQGALKLPPVRRYFEQDPTPSFPPLSSLLSSGARIVLSPDEVEMARKGSESFLERLSASGLLIPIGGGFMAFLPALQARLGQGGSKPDVIIQEITRTTGARIVDGVAICSRRLGLHIDFGKFPDYESDGLRLSVKALGIQFRIAPASEPWRLYGARNRYSDITRVMSVMSQSDLALHADRIVAGLSRSQKSGLKRQLSALPPRLRSRIETALSKSGMP